MLDIKYIIENKQVVQKVCRDKNVDVDIDALISVYQKKNDLQKELEDIKAQKNEASKEIVKASKEEKANIITNMSSLGEKEQDLSNQFKEAQSHYLKLLKQIPNIISEDTPIGKDESENVVIRAVLEKPSFSFQIKDHETLGKELDLIDKEKAANITGSRFAYLKNEAVLLEFALINYAFHTLTNEAVLSSIIKEANLSISSKPFIPVLPPVMIKPDIFEQMARLTDADKDDKYYLPQDDLYLIGSAEHTLGPLHLNEVLKEKDLPLRYVGFSTSFRREAGSYGKDVSGILRMHQFDKIEMLSFSTPENSTEEQNFFVAIQEHLMKGLNLPYQVMQVCSGDMGKPDFRQIDINTWIPSQNMYRETQTSDLMTDYQTRRLNTKIQLESKEKVFAHTNDATVFAIGRILIAILENNQQEDGSILIPEILHPYMLGKTIIEK